MIISKNREKYCNNCGDSVGVFKVKDNAPICKVCWKKLYPKEEFAEKKTKKKIPNEATRVKKLLEGDKNQKKLG